jgi:hypothetical protein
VGLSKLKLVELNPTELQGLSPDKLMLRWLNYHRVAGATGDLAALVDNFGADCQDATAFSALLSRVGEAKDPTIDTTDQAKTSAQV